MTDQGRARDAGTTRSHANWSARGRAPADDEAGLRDALDDNQPRRREAALGLVDVAESGLAEETVTALARQVRTAGDPQTRQFAVEALGVAGTGASAVRDGLADPDEWVRAEAVVALSRTAPDAADRLRAALDDESGPVRRNALIALGKTGRVDDDLLVDRLKHDPAPSVREYAAQYLGDAEQIERVVRILAAVLARDPGPFVRAKAAESLGDLGTDRAEEALETHGLGDRSDDVRRTAERALARSRGVDPDELEVDAAGPASGPGGSHPASDGPAGEPAPGGASERPRPPGGADATPGRIDDGAGPPPRTGGSNGPPDPVRNGSRPVGSHPGPDPRPQGYSDEPTDDTGRDSPPERPDPDADTEEES